MSKNIRGYDSSQRSSILINRVDGARLTLSTKYSHADFLCIALMWKTCIVWSTGWEGAANSQSLEG